MAKCSTYIFTFLNLLIFMVGLASIATSWYFRSHNSDCHELLKDPLLILGIILAVVSLLGLLGSCCWIAFLLVIYSVITFFMAIVAIVFIIFVIIITNTSANKALSHLGFEEYRIGDYNNWLREHFVEGGHWSNVKSCIIESDVCAKFGEGIGFRNGIYYTDKRLSAIQSGCCKPPIYCRFDYKNGTTWIKPKTGPAVDDPDCRIWSNDKEKLCYDCNSCKGGFLDSIRKDWRILGGINLCIFWFILIIYSTSYCAKNNIDHSRI